MPAFSGVANLPVATHGNSGNLLQPNDQVEWKVGYGPMQQSPNRPSSNSVTPSKPCAPEQRKLWVEFLPQANGGAAAIPRPAVAELEEGDWCVSGQSDSSTPSHSPEHSGPRRRSSCPPVPNAPPNPNAGLPSQTSFPNGTVRIARRSSNDDELQHLMEAEVQRGHVWSNLTRVVKEIHEIEGYEVRLRHQELLLQKKEARLREAEQRVADVEAHAADLAAIILQMKKEGFVEGPPQTAHATQTDPQGCLRGGNCILTDMHAHSSASHGFGPDEQVELQSLRSQNEALHAANADLMARYGHLRSKYSELYAFTEQCLTAQHNLYLAGGPPRRCTSELQPLPRTLSLPRMSNGLARSSSSSSSSLSSSSSFVNNAWRMVTGSKPKGPKTS